VILDIYSRYVVGWMVATRESAVLAEKLIAATCAKQGITRGQLSIHADRGSSMTSNPVALLRHPPWLAAGSCLHTGLNSWTHRDETGHCSRA
jgi:hypothetical protein